MRAGHAIYMTQRVRELYKTRRVRARIVVHAHDSWLMECALKLLKVPVNMRRTRYLHDTKSS